MTYSKQKLHTLRPQKSKALSTFLLALLTAAAVFVPFMVADNGYFFFYGDFNVQQIPFYQHCHELVRSGQIGWDFGTDLGANFIGSYTFYLLGSPFFWLTLPFPNSLVPYLIGPLFILKFACCALTAYLYISRFTKTTETARLGALLYAFSGFSVYNIFFNHFHEAIIVFPLLLLSIELMITENRRGVFAFMVFLCATVNYFFFFGMVVFAVIYWFIRMYSGAIKMRPARFVALAFEAVLGLLMSAFIMLPTIMALAGNSRLSETLIGWGAWMYGKEQIYGNVIQCFFFPPDLPARPVFFPEADVKWSSLGGWLPIFSMVGVFAWVQGKKGNWLKRIICTLTFMALVPILNSAFYMFNHAYYARWYYMLTLMMALATCMAIEDREVSWESPFRWVTAITVGITAVFGFSPRSLDEDGNIAEWGLYMQDDNGTYRTRFFMSCAIAVISLIILRALLTQRHKNHKFFLRASTVCVCVMSVIYASVFVGLGKTHSYNVDEVMIPLAQSEITLDGDRGDYRVDAYECVDNTGMYLNFNCINAFHSIVPVSVTEFYEFIGEERGVASRPTTDSYAARSLLSVKYLLDLKDNNNFETDGITEMPCYSFIDSQCGYDIYENQNYIPYGFTYDYYMTESECLYYGEENAANMMLKAILLDDEQIAKYSHVLTSINLDYSFTSPAEDGKQVLYFDDYTYTSDCEERAATAAYEFTQGKNSFTAKIDLNRDNLVFFSVPYDEGWTAYVNGEKAEIEKVNVGFMAVLAPAGDCEIYFEYETPGLSMGIMVTAVCLLIFIVYTIFASRFAARRDCGNTFPEGDELLERWRAYDTADAVAAIEESDEDEFETPDDDFPDITLPEGGFTINKDAFSQKDIDNDII